MAFSNQIVDVPNFIFRQPILPQCGGL
jgi:hypothetical protein